jgi:hypothetical protein
MGRDAKVEVRVEKRRFSEGLERTFSWGRWTGKKPKMISLYVVLVNGRRVDSFLKRRNAVAKARRIISHEGLPDTFSDSPNTNTRCKKLCEEYNIYTMKDLIRWLTPERVKANMQFMPWDKHHRSMYVYNAGPKVMKALIQAVERYNAPSL